MNVTHQPSPALPAHATTNRQALGTSTSRRLDADRGRIIHRVAIAALINICISKASSSCSNDDNDNNDNIVGGMSAATSLSPWRAAATTPPGISNAPMLFNDRY
jgi:hypothetical protein